MIFLNKRKSRKTKIRKAKIRVGVFVSCAAASVYLFAVPVYAADEDEGYGEVEEITVTVGYWGSTEYTRGTLAVEDLSDLFDVHQEIYTWIDNKPTAGTTEAEGVYLSDIMDYYDIDLESVYYFNFETLDAATYVGATVQWQYDDLFCSRYTFKMMFQLAVEDFLSVDLDEFNANVENYFRISDFFNMAEDKEDASYLDNAWENRESVEPMLALTAYSERWTSDYPSSLLDFSNQSDENMPQLLYGMQSADEVGRQMMGKMISGIHLWFYGSPTILSDYYDLEDEVGTTTSLNVRVKTPDTYLSSMILDEITYTSSDESVAVVDESGNVTITGEGTATIRVIYDGSTEHKVGVTGTAASEEEDSDDDGSGDDEGSGSGDGDGSGDGSGEGSGSGSSDGDGGSGDGESVGEGEDASGEDAGGSGAEDDGDTGDVSGSGEDSESSDTDTDDDTIGPGDGLQQSKEDDTGRLYLGAPDSTSDPLQQIDQTTSDTDDSADDTDDTTADDTQDDTQSEDGADAGSAGSGERVEEEITEEETDTDVVSAKIYEVDPDTENILELETDEVNLKMIILVLVLFGAGAAGEGIYYRRQTAGNRSFIRKSKETKT